MCPVFTEDMALFVIYVFPFFEISFSERVTARNPKGFPSSVSRGHDAVQRETRRQLVKRHMRVHNTVAEPSNIQQKVHRRSFATLCGLCDECSFQRSLFSTVGCPCMHQEAIMSECSQAYPEYIAPCERNNRVKAMVHRP